MGGFDLLSFSRQDAKNAKRATIQMKSSATKGEYKFIGLVECLFLLFSAIFATLRDSILSASNDTMIGSWRAAFTLRRAIDS